MITCVRCWQTLGCPGWGDTTVPRRTCRWHWRTPCAPWSRSRPETPRPAAPWSPSCRPQTACRTRPLPATPPCSTVWTHTKRQCCAAWPAVRDNTASVYGWQWETTPAEVQSWRILLEQEDEPVWSTDQDVCRGTQGGNTRQPAVSLCLV